MNLQGWIKAIAGTKEKKVSIGESNSRRKIKLQIKKSVRVVFLFLGIKIISFVLNLVFSIPNLYVIFKLFVNFS